MSNTLLEREQQRKKFFAKISSWLSHRPTLYALIGGIGVILFWRGVWITADFVMATIKEPIYHGSSIDLSPGMWWDGPLTMVIGAALLILISAFVSSLIGNEIIISGLRAEKSIEEKESKEIRTETMDVEQLRQMLDKVDAKIDELEEDLNRKKKQNA